MIRPPRAVAAHVLGHLETPTAPGEGAVLVDRRRRGTPGQFRQLGVLLLATAKGSGFRDHAQRTQKTSERTARKNRAGGRYTDLDLDPALGAEDLADHAVA